MATGQSTYFDDELYFNDSNPFKYGGYIGQCTWYCWSKAHAKAAAYPSRKLNVSNLPTGDAGTWATTAENNGYTVSMTPKADSIAVWSGHVAYVETWDSSTATVCFSEANWNSTTNASNTINVPSNVHTAISNYVSALTSTVTVNSGGTDGQFKELSRTNFEGRGTFYGYIYLN